MAKMTDVCEDSLITENYSLYCGDSCRLLPFLPSEKIGLVTSSLPFVSLFSYSDKHNDLSNCATKEEFFEHFRFIVKEIYRILMPGRVCVWHCMILPTHKSGGEEIGLYDFPGDIVKLCVSEGFIFHSHITLWKDALLAATRTKAIGLAHKQIIKDSALCRTGIADFCVAFRKPGINPVPIKHPRGLTEHYGSRQVPKELDRFLEDDPDNPYDPKIDKRSHWIWQQMASPVWFDIRFTKTLQVRGTKDPDDVRHLCPLSLDVINRSLELWSTKGDIVLDPFSGLGSVALSAIKKGRKGIGLELNRRYHNAAKKNLKSVFLKGNEE